MGGIKTIAADEWFSKCVRERVEWKCERCGKWFSPTAARGLDCSHFVGRSNWSVRFDPDNAFAHCMGCHSYFEKNPHEFVEWVKGRLNGRYKGLIARSRDISIGKLARRSKAEISSHYRETYRSMRRSREENAVGRLEFQAWNA